MLEYDQSDDAITFAVRVVPRASRSGVAGMYDGALRVRVAAPPVEGAANEELSRFLARALGVAPSAVEITSGHASKNKRVRVHGADRTRLLALLQEAT
jgi:uncharacterized protein (TIGR00251 family)